MIKYLEKKVEIFPSESSGEVKKNIELEYYLIESDFNSLDGISGEKVYGIEIIKRTEEEKYECEMIRNFSNSEVCTKDLLEKLATHKVTPVALPFVMDDLLGA
jgi:hypothetical protein